MDPAKYANWVAKNHDNSRLASRMGQNKVDTMTMIIHTLPGISVTYYVSDKFIITV